MDDQIMNNKYITPVDKTAERVFISLPARNNHSCFACGQSNDTGLKMKFYTDGNALFSDLTIPDRFCGWSNVVHGGILSTIMDEIMGWSAICFCQQFIFTKTFTIQYLKAVHTNTPITVNAKIMESAEREAILNGSIHSAEGTLLTQATGCFALIPIEKMKQKNLLDQNTIEDFQAFFSDITRFFNHLRNEV